MDVVEEDLVTASIGGKQKREKSQGRPRSKKFDGGRSREGLQRKIWAVSLGHIYAELASRQPRLTL